MGIGSSIRPGHALVQVRYCSFRQCVGPLYRELQWGPKQAAFFPRSKAPQSVKTPLMSIDYQALRRSENNPHARKSFADALFGGQRPWYLQKIAEEVQAVVAEERTQVLQGLKTYVEEEAEKRGSEKIAFPGGEVALQPAEHRRVRKLDQPLSERLEAPLCELIPEALVVVGETSEPKQKELLGRMIQAMKLGDRPVLRLALPDQEEEHQDWAHNVLLHLGHLRPAAVLSLGALSTNLLFGEKERLTRIHGQFFDFTVRYANDERTFPLIPVFHPEFLLINPKMKEAAWSDLKKVMEFLGIELA